MAFFMMEINILGTDYFVIFVKEKDKFMIENDYIGYCDYANKTIVVLEDENEQHTLRHEIIHAYMFESGIQYGTEFHNELCVDWMATQLPKINITLNNFSAPSIGVDMQDLVKYIQNAYGVQNNEL